MGWDIVRVFYWQTSERQDQVERVWMSLMDCKAFLEAAYSPMQPHYNLWGWNYILKSMYLHGSICNVFNGYTHFIHCLSYFVCESQFATVGYTQMGTATISDISITFLLSYPSDMSVLAYQCQVPKRQFWMCIIIMQHCHYYLIIWCLFQVIGCSKIIVIWTVRCLHGRSHLPCTSAIFIFSCFFCSYSCSSCSFRSWAMIIAAGLYCYSGCCCRSCTGFQAPYLTWG